MNFDRFILLLVFIISSNVFAANYFDVQGHRGARAERPENTISAFKYALDLGVDTLELDLNVTKDDVLVVIHDSTINTMICRLEYGIEEMRGKVIRQLSLEQIKQYDCGSKRNPFFPSQIPQPHEKIPTLEELFVWLKNESNPHARKVYLNIEMKSDSKKPGYSPEPKVFAKLVTDLVKKYKLQNRTVLQSFDFRTLTAAKEIDPKIKISALLSSRPKEGLAALAQRLKLDIISPNYSFIRKVDVDALHQIGVKVIPWTPNTVSGWKKLSSMNVDGIISDNPRKLLEYREAIIMMDSELIDKFENDLIGTAED